MSVLSKLEPIDIIAILVIGGCFTLMWFGRDGVITSVLMMIVGFYFGRKTR